MKIESARKDIPILKRSFNDRPLIYFDNAATTQKPTVVIDVLKDYYENSNANINRGLYSLSHESTKLWNNARDRVAKFINAQHAEEIVFTKSCTESLNLVANTFCRDFVQEGDVIVITEMEHHSNILPWQQIAKAKKAKLEWLPVLDNYELDLNYLDYLLLKYKERVRILSVSHVSNVLGSIVDIPNLAKKIHSVGGVLCVDAAQSIAHIPIDVQNLDCDFLAFSGHKVYSPMGTGVLYGKKHLLEKLNPWLTGGDMVNSMDKNSVEWASVPQKFEAGTQNVAGVLALAEGVSWLENFGWESLCLNEEKLVKTCLAGLLSICNIKILGKDIDSKRLGIVSFKIGDIHPHDIASLLDEKGIAVRAGYHCAEPLHKRFGFGPSLRVSFGVYNTQDEVKDFLNSIRSISNRFF